MTWPSPKDEVRILQELGVGLGAWAECALCIILACRGKQYRQKGTHLLLLIAAYLDPFSNC